MGLRLLWKRKKVWRPLERGVNCVIRKTLLQSSFNSDTDNLFFPQIWFDLVSKRHVVDFKSSHLNFNRDDMSWHNNRFALWRQRDSTWLIWAFMCAGLYTVFCIASPGMIKTIACSLIKTHSIYLSTSSVLPAVLFYMQFRYYIFRGCVAHSYFRDCVLDVASPVLIHQ